VHICADYSITLLVQIKVITIAAHAEDIRRFIPDH